MTGLEFLNQAVELLVGGLVGIASGIGEGAQTLVSALVYDAEGNMSVFAIIVLVFGGIALAIGFSTLIFTWIRTLGK